MKLEASGFPLSRGGVRLELLDENHGPGLLEIGREPSIWTWMARGPFVDAADVAAFVRQARSTPEASVPLAIVGAGGQVMGSTRLMRVHTGETDLEVGWTFVGVPFQRTAVNTTCKRLLFGHAFEVLGAERVVLKTDLRNLRSQAAIERVGGGTRHVVAPDRVMNRDSAYYFIEASRWPGLRERLDGLLDRSGPDAP